jgi:large repetitive protein
VTFAVTSSGGTPTGNVTVSDGSATCVGTVAAGTCTLTPTTAGAKTLTATYGGDANFGGSVSVGVGHTVNASGTTTTLGAGTPNPAVVGQPVSFPFTVVANAPGSGTPTGTVTVSDGTQSCAASVATGTCSIAFGTAGGRTMTASYAGDGNYAVSGSSGVSQTVNPASTVTTITGDTPDPSTVGQPYTVTYTVAVSAPGSGSPAGSVTVSDGTSTCNGTVASGSCSLISLTPGAKTLTATYAGNADFATSTSGGEAHTVTLTGTTTAITAHSPNPSVVGEGIAVIYTVTPASGTGTPTGNVTVSDGFATCVASVGVGTCTLTPTTAGAKTLTASYPGDATFAGSTSPGVGQTVNPASTTTTITSNSPNPSVAGQAIAVHFTVTSSGGTPTGSVTVTDGAVSCVTTVAAGTCNLAPTIAGSRTLTATYAGDANFSGSTSPGVGQTVNPDAVSATQSTVVAAPTAITASSGASQSTITVTAKDGFGNPISGASVVISASGSANTLSLPPATDGNGVSTATLSATVAEDKKISATINGVAISQGATVTVVAGTATQLQFTTQPSDVNVLATIQVVATAFDAFGNAATSFGGNVTVAIGNDASLLPPATLGGTLTVAPTLGVATFGDLTIDKAGVGYTLVVNASGLSGATSNPFTVIALP